MTRFQYYRVVEQGDVLHGPVSRIEAGSLAEAAEVMCTLERIRAPWWVWRDGGWETEPDPRARADRRRWRVEAVR